MLPPKIVKKPKELSLHGHKIIDNYAWLRNKDDEDVIKYLEAENKYTDTQMKPLAKLQNQLFEELKGRIKEKDESVPAKCDNYFYSSKFEEGREYPIYSRRENSTSGKEEILLDLNIFAKVHDFVMLGTYDWSNNHQILAYSLDTDGSEEFTLKFRDLKSGKDLPESISTTSYGSAWAKDNQTFFYTKLNENQRPHQVWRHALGTDPIEDVLVFEDSDSRFSVSVDITNSGDFLIIETEGVNTSEAHFLDAGDPCGQFQCFAERNFGVEYTLSHQQNRWFITTNENALDFKIMTTPIGNEDRCNWIEYIPHKLGRMIEGISAFKEFVVVGIKERARESIQIINNKEEKHVVSFPEDVASIGFGTNLEFDTDTIRLQYSSPITPATVFDYHVESRSLKTLKVQEIPSGYDKKLYSCKLVYAPARDGKEIPVTLVYAKSTPLDGTSPAYLWAYGSYGYGISDTFSASWLSLLDRGMVCGIAHIRGGDEMGRQWYEDGKLLTKMNTFNDYIDCSKFLIDEKWTSKGKLVGCGGSAGGMLMGAVANASASLYAALVAHVPFVDCLNTMLDETLPLTAGEYNEWGNPNEKEYFDMIKSYSPYDNVLPKEYPNLLITAGLNDPRVTYWEPAKWVAKLRELKTDKNLLLLKTNMEAGHGGKTGRYESLHEKALEYAFILNCVDITD